MTAATQERAPAESTANSQRRPPQASRLPLYLYGKAPTHVGVDGPALRVQVVHKAPVRYPLTRIARVIAGARVEWQAAALSVCQQEGLPIVFLGPTGEPTGYLQPMQGKPSRLDGVLEEMLDRPDWAMHYQHWLRAERMQQVQRWRQAQESAGKPVEDAHLRELIRQHVYQPSASWAHYAQSEIQAGAITAYVLHALHRAGVKPRYWATLGAPLNLADDLAHLLALGLHLELQGLCAAAHADTALLLRVLHSFGARLDEEMVRLLGGLHRRFKNQLEEWR